MPGKIWFPSPNKFITILWMGLLSMGILSNPLFSYQGRDSGIFLYIGSLILKGKLPYLDVWENKGPLVFYINALGLLLANGSRWGIWFLEFLVFLISGCIGYFMIKRLMGATPALVGTFVWVTAAGTVLQGGNFSEEYALLFSFVALFGYLNSLEFPRRRLYVFLIGVSLGLNILLRPNNIGVQVAVIGSYFVMAVFSKDWRLFLERLMLAAFGATVVLVPVILYFHIQGALTEMVNIVLVFNYQYSEGKDLSHLFENLTSASASIGMVLVSTGLVGYILSLYLIFRRNTFDTLLGKFLLVLLMGWPIEAALSTLSGRNYAHYFIGWAPYIGIFSAFLVYVILQRFVQRQEKYTGYVLLVLMTATLLGHINTWRDYGAVMDRLLNSKDAVLEYYDPVALYILENTSPEDKVFVWGFRPVINFVAGRESPVAYLPYPLAHVRSELADRWAEQFYAQFTSNPPALVINMIEEADRNRIPDLNRAVRKVETIRYKDVVLAPNLKDILDFIGDNYVLVGEVDGSDIYRLKTTLP
jgi:Dolichyl-phosphate-mannose-protein mannosyltransferase